MKGITENKIQRVITFRELLSRRLEANAAINYMHCSKGRNLSKKSAEISV